MANGTAGQWLRGARDVGVPAVLAIIVLTQLAPPIYEGVAIARSVRDLMILEQSTGVVCRQAPPSVGAIRAVTIALR